MKNKVNILGTVYKLVEATQGELFDKYGDNIVGHIDYKKKLIEYCNEGRVTTLLHEYLHGLFFEAGFDVENEENLIEFLCRHIEKIIIFYSEVLPLEGKDVTVE